ncbi:MAG: type III-B CRISPR module RAMP protein Cmr4 [Candidatus Brocadia carolinensis]|uniref:Type III-B CRISPR module RAMP protein Cmr4 n=1 Tax=Candidatus Brocadia carolinensis TaxID=1004156 RepID=A0A1V4AT88_9BACT|nr:MAG: type III-B CRISPR module RAMP protein Cmr4 [Candidatus Brocadia caroliniensis]
MFKKAKLFFIICETPLHCGSGNNIGIVDLPIQRERHTDFPKVEGSSLKGGIREAFEELVDIKDKKAVFLETPSKEKLKKVFSSAIEEYWKDKDGNALIKFNEAIFLSFGPEEGSDYAGALGFSDARLLLFPVKSMKGVFAWVTCPQVLERFKNDFKLCGITLPFEMPKENAASNGCSLFIKDNRIVLEEYTFEITKDSDANGNCTKLTEWLSQNLFPAGGSQFWMDKIKKDIVIIPNEEFRDFVTLSTEVITRTKINNETGTVQDGALFDEEYLPSETILYSLALASPVFKKEDADKGIFKQNGKTEEELVMEFFTNGLPEVIQLGGNATIGKGIIRTKVLEGGTQ